MQTRANAEIVVYYGQISVTRQAEIHSTIMTGKRIVKNQVQVQNRKSEVARHKGAGRSRKQRMRAEFKKPRIRWADTEGLGKLVELKTKGVS